MGISYIDKANYLPASGRIRQTKRKRRRCLAVFITYLRHDVRTRRQGGRECEESETERGVEGHHPKQNSRMRLLRLERRATSPSSDPVIGVVTS